MVMAIEHPIVVGHPRQHVRQQGQAAAIAPQPVGHLRQHVRQQRRLTGHLHHRGRQHQTILLHLRQAEQGAVVVLTAAGGEAAALAVAE